MGPCTKASQVRPRLGWWAREIKTGYVGRVGVLGGALESVIPLIRIFCAISHSTDAHSYTGAPFFAAMSALRLV